VIIRTAVFTAFILALLIGGQRAQAQTPLIDETISASRCAVTEQTSIRVVLTCDPGFASPRDQVAIYSRNIDPTWVYPTSARERLPEMRDGFWVFDIGADGTTNLVIQFSRGDNDEAIADFFTDLDGDGQVGLRPLNDGELPRTTEAAIMRMVAPDGWWYDGERVNYNLTITIDGQMRGNFGVGLYLNHPFWTLLKNDGDPDFTIDVRDEDRDGRPDYEWRQFYLKTSETDGYPRTEINYNTQDDEGLVTSFIFWHYLGMFDGNINSYVKAIYGESLPPIAVDWTNSTIPIVSEFVASRANAGNYFVYSLYRLLEDVVTRPNFEAPFAFYNLTGIAPEIPDLLIRAAYNPPESMFFSDGDTNPDTRNAIALQEMYYAWHYPISADRTRAPIWDYSLSIAGRHEYDDEVTVGPLTLVMPQYADLPNWVIDRPWDFATLNANEGGGFSDSEAIPRWSVLEGIDPLGSLYISGSINEPPFARRFTNIDAGMRADMAPALQQQLWLYIDSLDGKLHLQKTQFGMWRINALGVLHYRNLNNDDYIDQWTYTQGGRVRQQLTRAGNYMVLEDGATLRVAYMPLPPSLHEMLPPVTGAELLALHEAVATTGVEFAPNDLAARFDLFEVPTWDITEMALSNLRLVDDGFEAVLQLTSDSETGGTFPIEVTSELGELVTLRGQGDRLTLEPLEPPLIIIDAINVGLDPEVRLLYDRQRVEVRLRNESLIDIENVQVRVNARQGSTLISLLDSPVDLPGKATTDTGVVWEPSNTGEWQIEVNVDVRWNEETVTLRQTETVIISPETIQSVDYLDLWGQLPLSGALQLTLLLGGMLIVICLFALIYRRMTQS